MRLIALAAVAALLVIPAAKPVYAAQNTDISAAKKKANAKNKPKKEKVEYMRAVPSK